MLDDVHTYASLDPRFVTLQGYQNRVVVRIQIDALAIDDLPGVGIKPTEAQRQDFARLNLEAIRQIAEKKLEAGEAYPEDHGEVPALGVRICDVDFAEYLDAGNQLSLAAFGLGARMLLRQQVQVGS